MLEAALDEFGVADSEFAFRALPEHELRAADVAFVTAARWQAIEPGDNLRGAPDLAIEILSRSNTAAEMDERERLCLENGAREFWTVDVARRQIRVAAVSKSAQTFGPGQAVPMNAFGANCSLAVSEIFADS